MQVDGIKPQIHYLLEHLPDWFEKVDPTEIPAALWNQNNNTPEQLAGDDAVGPDCLDQLNEQLPIIPSGWILRRVGVLLILDCREPPLDIFSTHPQCQCTSGAAIGQSDNRRPNLVIVSPMIGPRAISLLRSCTLTGLRFLVSLALQHHHGLKQGDCKNAFCQGILPPDKVTIVRPPSGDPDVLGAV